MDLWFKLAVGPTLAMLGIFINTYNGDPLHLPVMVVEGTSARLITGYFSENDYKGTLVWSTNDV